jgi:membrane protein YdbS with pleckstrin-like domain
MRYYRQEQNNSKIVGDITISMLLVAFVVLKLCGVIDWSWWWVLSPLWIPLGFVILVLLVLGIAKLALKIMDKKAERRRKSNAAL